MQELLPILWIALFWDTKTFLANYKHHFSRDELQKNVVEYQIS